MKATSLVTGLLLTLALVSSGFADWVPNGIPLTSNPFGQAGQVATPDSFGGAIVVWRHEENDSYDVYAQRVTAEGNIAAGWPANGLPVCTAPEYQGSRNVISDGAGGAYLPWIDYRNYSNSWIDIYLQHVLGDGSIAAGWSVDGIPICTAPGDQWTPFLASDGSGGVFIVWQDYRRGTFVGDSTQVDLYGSRINADGTTAAGWPADGLALVTAPGLKGTFSLMPDGSGGLFLIWTDYRAPGSDIYALRIDGQGHVAPGWMADGIPLCNAPGYQGLQALTGVVSDGQGGLLVAWVDARTAPPEDLNLVDNFDIFAQRVTGSGSVAPGWPEDGIPVCTAPNTQQDHKMISDASGGTIVVWSDYRNYEPNAADLYAQRILVTGEIAPGWPVDGVPLSEAPSWQYSPTMVTDGAGGALVAYESGGGDNDLYVQHVTASGTIASGWDPMGVPLCVLPDPQIDPYAVSDGKGGMIVTWGDGRGSGYDIYAQRVTGDFPTVAVVSLVSAEAEPGRVTLRWFSDAVSPSARVYRRQESSPWAAIGNAARADGVLIFEDRSVTAGRYAYRLGYAGENGEAFTPEEWVTVPSGHVLALAGFSPNPATTSPVVSFSLATSENATLDVFDVTGRVVFTQQVGALGPGHHRIALGRELTTAPGVYWIRIHQAGKALTAKGLVIR